MPDLFDPTGASGRSRHLTTQAAPRSPSPVPETGEPLLLCLQVSKWYGPVRGVLQVTLELRGGITGLVGANGAGKSTLLRLITGQLRPDTGRVTIGGIDAWSSDARRLVGYCPDSDAFYEEMSGFAFVESMARLCGYSWREARRRTEAVIDRVGMTGRAERKLRGYSKGMRQRIKLAQALLHDPPLLILDEPLSGIDPVGRAEMVMLFRTLAEQGKCLLVSSHELEELEKLTEHVVIMSNGRIAAADTVPRIRERLFEHPMTICIDVKKDGDKDHRSLAALLLSRIPDVTAIEMSDLPGNVGRLLIQARSSRSFLEELNKLVVEEWYEIVSLKPIDESTHAVLEYLLAGRR